MTQDAQAKPEGKGGGKPKNNSFDPTARHRPAPIGISTGHPSITAGTIGCRVTDGLFLFALSNNHVYAASNSASIGDALIQPGTFDGGSSSADDIGTLADYEPLNFSTGAVNVMDAAIALIAIDSEGPVVGNATGPDGYGTPGTNVLAAAYGNKVMKSGRTTGFTSGKIIGIGATLNVGYGEAGVALFEGQIIIDPGTFSAGGDSGSLIVHSKSTKGKRVDPDIGKPVGLLFAGSQTVTIANPIDVVLTRFGVTVDGN